MTACVLQRVHDIIHQLRTGFDTLVDLSDFVLKRITSNSSAHFFFSSLINNGKCQLSLVSNISRAERDP